MEHHRHKRLPFQNIFTQRLKGHAKEERQAQDSQQGE